MAYFQADTYSFATELLVSRHEGGTGTGRWAVSRFRDGSVLVEAMGVRRVSPSARLALDYWRTKGCAQHLSECRATVAAIMEELAHHAAVDVVAASLTGAQG